MCTVQVVPGAGSEEELLGCLGSVVPGLSGDWYVVCVSLAAVPSQNHVSKFTDILINLCIV